MKTTEYGHPVHQRTPKPVTEQFKGRWETIEQRFWAKVSKPDSPLVCWEWTGYRRQRGYGELDHVAAHRLSYYLATGEDPGSYFVCHRCDNPPCVNPLHLYLGTPRENQNEMWLKGRGKGWETSVSDEQVKQIQEHRRRGATVNQIAAATAVSYAHVARILRGEFRVDEVTPPPYNPEFKHASQKLTDAQVLEIRAVYARGGVSQRVLAARYGISQGHLSHIVRSDRKGRPHARG